MSIAGQETESFPQLGSLPLEVRRMIWDATLPDCDDAPSLYVFDETFMTNYIGREEDKFVARGDPVLVNIPLPELFHVSCEARDAVRAWAKKHRLQTCLYKPDLHTQYAVLTRHWDSAKDVLFVQKQNWFSLWMHVGSWGSTLPMTNLAIPLSVAVFETIPMVTVIRNMPNIKIIYLVWGDEPAAEPVDCTTLCPVGPEEVVDDPAEWPKLTTQLQAQWELRYESGRAEMVHETGGYAEDVDVVASKIYDVFTTINLPDYCFDSAGTLALRFAPVKAYRK